MFRASSSCPLCGGDGSLVGRVFDFRSVDPLRSWIGVLLVLGVLRFLSFLVCFGGVYFVCGKWIDFLVLALIKSSRGAIHGGIDRASCLQLQQLPKPRLPSR